MEDTLGLCVECEYFDVKLYICKKFKHEAQPTDESCENFELAHELT